LLLCAEACSSIQIKFETYGSSLNEKQRRIWAASEAINVGWGGISLVAKSTGISRTTITKGIVEIKNGVDWEQNTIRIKGGGRKKKEYYDPNLRTDILKCINPVTRGDPESPLRWISKSLRNIVRALIEIDPTRSLGVSVVSRILKEEIFNLQKNQKTKEGGNHPDRDMQFHKIDEKSNDFIEHREPLISIDGKKKELIGNFKNEGREWNPKGKPTEVEVYDYLPKDGIKAVPYGIYDVALNKGFVNLGTSADTAVFAGKSILKWWEEVGRYDYPNATRLMITADGGGSNGSRVRLWKVIVQELADKIGIPITVCHYPPGTSKWNKIEHRLFAPISLNWRGEPLETLDKMEGLIANTTNKGGLKVICRKDLNKYEKGIKISDRQLSRINIIKDEFHGEWNYVIYPRRMEKN
jgi:hypothetical protein